MPTEAAPRWDREVEVLYTAATLQARVASLGAQICQDYRGRDLCLVGVLKGSFLFLADLARAIDLPLSCNFIGISSYAGATRSSGVVQITQDLQQSIEGMHVLLVEDIIDSGLSMRYLLDNFALRRPASLSVCSLLVKPGRTSGLIPIDYIGFEIPDAFVVGYGLDLAERFRNLPYLGVYRGAT